MNQIRNLAVVLVVLLSPMVAVADTIVIRSSDVFLIATATASSGGVTSSQTMTYSGPGTEDFSAGAEAEVPSGDPSEAATRHSSAHFYTDPGGYYAFYTESYATSALWDEDEGGGSGYGLGIANMVFSVEGSNVDFRGWIMDFEGGPDTFASILLRDLTAGDTILQIDLSEPENYSFSERVQLLDGHTYEVNALAYNGSGGDEETEAGWWFLNADTVRVPEPGTLALFAIGLFGMGLARRKKV